MIHNSFTASSFENSEIIIIIVKQTHYIKKFPLFVISFHENIDRILMESFLQCLVSFHFHLCSLCIQILACMCMTSCIAFIWVHTKPGNAAHSHRIVFCASEHKQSGSNQKILSYSPDSLLCRRSHGSFPSFTVQLPPLLPAASVLPERNFE